MVDVFVYGTLKKDKHNHDLMGDSVLLGKAVTKDKFCMNNVGFPHVFDSAIEGDDELLPVVGEVYTVSGEVLDELDWLEGTPHHYYRRIVSVQLGDETTQAYMYVTQDDHKPDRFREENLKFKTEEGEWEWH